MIGYVKGTILDVNQSSLIVLAGSIGYEVFVPSVSGYLSDDPVEFFTYTHVREDILALYGFKTKDELSFFKLLITVSGIGPKVALAIVGSAPLEKLKDSIAKSDPSMLSAVSGVGKKTAEKAVVELKGKIGKGIGTGIFGGGETDDIFDALASLGFARVEVATVVGQIPEEITGTEARVKAALKLLSKRG